MKLALVQLTASEHKEDNLRRAERYIHQAAVADVDMIVFPEMFMACLPAGTHSRHADIAEPLDGPFVSRLQELAAASRIALVAGLYEKHPDDPVRAYNTVVMLDSAGTLLHYYRKTHLYDAFAWCESEAIIPGDLPLQVVETAWGKIGLLVCYELRFPEISRTLALQGAELLLVPTAWVAGAMKEEHLLSLVKARALENTLYVAVADQIGPVFAGRTVVYDPLGVTVASLGEEEALLMAEIDFDRVRRCREKLPCLSQRRPELYRLI